MIKLLIMFYLCVSSGYTADHPLEGGACEYKKYAGYAKIISITPHKNKPNNYSHDIFEVKYTFISDQVDKEKYGRVEGKEFVLLLNNSNYPGSKFIEKYNIKIGNVFKCNMKIIVKGTCSPVVFEFPTINLDDY